MDRDGDLQNLQHLVGEFLALLGRIEGETVTGAPDGQNTIDAACELLDQIVDAAVEELDYEVSDEPEEGGADDDTE